MFNLQLNDRDIIEAIINNYYIVDYGYVTKVIGNKVNVTHATILKTQTAEETKETRTPNVELLTLSTGGLAINPEVKEGDKVLLVGLKTYVPKTKDVTQSKTQPVSLHYSRETLKAIPLCVFNGEAKVTLGSNEGSLEIKAEKKIALNGNSKQFVTWAELNAALQTLVTTLSSHTHNCTAPGTPSGPPVPTFTLDISQAKTTTIVTGG